MPSASTTATAHQLRSELSARFSRPLMTFFLRRIKDRSQAEDLTQEVLLRVVRACDAGQIERPESYVFKVAANLLRDRRRQVQGVGATGEIETPLAEALSAERVLLSQESLMDVLRALNELSELTRNIFILFRLENMKQKDIAALYGIGQSTVDKHVMKAMLHLISRS
jgi:RNA polymerase sigma factor (sigma-70 family)